MRPVMLILMFLVLDACERPQARPSSPAAPAGPSAADLGAAAVPAELKHLLPLARTWGIGDDVERGRLTNTATAEERQELKAAVDPYRQQINSWLDSFGNAAMPDEAASFLYLLESMDEMGI